MKKVFITIITIIAIVSCSFDPNGLMYSATHGEKPVDNAIYKIGYVDSNENVLAFTHRGIFNIKKEDYNNEKAYVTDKAILQYPQVNQIKVDGNAITFVNTTNPNQLIKIADASSPTTTTAIDLAGATILQLENKVKLSSKSNVNTLDFNGVTTTFSDTSKMPYYFYSTPDLSNAVASINNEYIMDKNSANIIKTNKSSKLCFASNIGGNWFLGFDEATSVNIYKVEGSKLVSKASNILLGTIVTPNSIGTFYLKDAAGNVYIQETDNEKFSKIDGSTGSITSNMNGYELLGLDKAKTSLVGIEITCSYVNGSDLYLGTAKQGIIKASNAKFI